MIYRKLVAVLLVIYVALLVSCNSTQTKQSEMDSIHDKSTQELIQILEQANDVNSPAFNLFLDMVEELKKRGQSATSAIAILVQNLDNKREDVRLYSILNLGFIGTPAKCSIPKLGNLLWEKDPGIRSAAAATIEAITNVDLVWSDEEIDPEPYGSINLDYPEGSVTEKARTWRQETGKNMEWSVENCGSTKYHL